MSTHVQDPDVMDMLWRGAEPVVFISREDFMRGLEGWDIKSFWVGGEIAVITAQNGPAFHFQTTGTKRQISRKMIMDFLRGIVAEHGYATTKTPLEDARQHRFNLLFGFEETGRDDYDVHYRITAGRLR